ncbi:ubiquinol-cytochrome C reductase hinge protein-domain-containing protein [Xylariaceae sp. FL0804]|nr:ubiquinol-cytochrome C reductase hinge protein-domain-containing protein [Xylariaceae sp. FL0804]
MGIWDSITDLVEAAVPWSIAEAEAPPAEDKESTESSDEAKDEEPEEEAEEEEDEEEEEEDEDEDEPKDPKETLEEECKNSMQCRPAKHHYDECVERVTNGSGEGEEGEDCVEEFFHLAHCASQCAAPRLWYKLK